MDDLVGIGKSVEKLVDVISRGIGVLYRPRAIRKEAEAKAAELRLLSRAKSEAEAENMKIVTDAEIHRAMALEAADSALFGRVIARISVQELRRQKNIEAVAEAAMSQLPAEVSDAPVEDDWISRFFAATQDVSDEEMQMLWGKILASEVTSPGSFSARTIQLFRELTRPEAEKFQIAWNLSFDGGYLIQPPQNRDDAWSHDWLQQFSLEFDDLLSIQAAGLIHNAESAVPFMGVMSANPRQLEIALKTHGKVARFKTKNPRRELHFPVVRFTRAGLEIGRLLDRVMPNGFLEHVAHHHGLELVSFGD